MPIEKMNAFKAPDAEGIADLVRSSVVAWLQTGGTELPTAASGFKLRKELAYTVLRGTGMCWRCTGCARTHKRCGA